jgi:hypothetical protein
MRQVLWLHVLAVLTLVSATSATAAPNADARVAQTLTGLVAIELAKDARLDVLSSADLREVVALEGEKQALGCDVDATSCLAEVAGAMGARYVVIGQLGTLADTLLLTMSLYDSDAGRAPGRVVAKGADAAKVGDEIPTAVVDLVKSVQVADGEKARVLVLDIRPEEPSDEPAAEESASAGPDEATLPWLLIGGGGAGVVGAAGMALGGVMGVLGYLAHDEAQNGAIHSEVVADYDRRDLLLVIGGVSAGAGALVVAGGLGLVGFHLVGGE